MISVEIHQLEYVLALQKHLHFSFAADSINVSQPTLSHQVRKLEEELSIDLFVRNTRSVLLTPAGEDFVIYAQRILSEIETAKNAMLEHAHLYKGRLKIGTTPILTYIGLIPIIAAFQKLYPGINIEIYEDETEKLLPKMNNFEIDVALIDSNNASEYDFDFYPFFRDEFVLLVSKFHPLAKCKVVELSSLAAEKFLIVAGLKSIFARYCHSGGFNPIFVLQSTQAQTVKGFVEEGLGISPFTGHFAHSLQGPKTKVIKITPSLERSPGLAIVKNNNLLVTKTFKDFLFNQFLKYK